MHTDCVRRCLYPLYEGQGGLHLDAFIVVDAATPPSYGH